MDKPTENARKFHRCDYVSQMTEEDWESWYELVDEEDERIEREKAFWND